MSTLSPRAIIILKPRQIQIKICDDINTSKLIVLFLGGKHHHDRHKTHEMRVAKNPRTTEVSFLDETNRNNKLNN